MLQCVSTDNEQVQTRRIVRKGCIVLSVVSHAVLLRGCKTHKTRHGERMTVGSDAVLTMTGNNDDEKFQSFANFVEHTDTSITCISYF
jgi:hypothetical protein